MKLFALTGGIGSGKSSVANRLEACGAVIVDSDLIVRDLQQPGSPVLAAMVDRFGPSITDEGGNLIRPAVAAIVFNDKKALADLGKIMKRPIRVETDRQTLVAADAGKPVVQDIPLLVETLEGRPPYSGIIVVDVDPNLPCPGWSASGPSPRPMPVLASPSNRPASSAWPSPDSWWTTAAPSKTSTARWPAAGRGFRPALRCRFPPPPRTERQQPAWPRRCLAWGAMPAFKVHSEFAPAGDQPRAIAALVEGVQRGDRFQTLLGITGSGKSATIAWTIEAIQKPTLVLAPNKSLAAQLANEFKEFFPQNRVEYFVSYYDYYQPEAYMPSSDTYIEKDSTVNDEIDRLRHSATEALLTRRDTIVVASVSAIYGLGSPEEYRENLLIVEVGHSYDQRLLLRKLVDMQYERNDMSLVRGKFRVRGDTLEIHAAYDESVIRISMFGDEVEEITIVDPLTGERLASQSEIAIFPATHYVTGAERMQRAITRIEQELQERLSYFENEGKLLEAQRLRMRTQYDLEMMAEVGFCSGIENYSAPIDGRAAGEPPSTLIDFFPKDFLMVLDESHQAVPQIHGQYEGDRSRKLTLIEHGFRLPSAGDNRPLRFEEWESRLNQCIFMSATPAAYEIRKSSQVVEQVVRPTGLVDPEIVVKPTKGQIDDLIEQINIETARGNRVLVTTLTKKMAEDLSSYFQELGVKVRYLHSDIDTLERVEILRDLRKGVFDVLIGINLLREGLDLPEVSLVAILDADKEGFLRSAGSLIQTSGRAARHVEGRVIMYANTVTDSMKHCLAETERRRTVQGAYNVEHGITPTSVIRGLDDARLSVYDRDYSTVPAEPEAGEVFHSRAELDTRIRQVEKDMKAAAANLDFERAASLRDILKSLRTRDLGVVPGPAAGE